MIMCFSQLIKEQREVERLGSQGGGTGAQPPNIYPPVSVTVCLVNNPVCRLQFSYQLLISVQSCSTLYTSHIQCLCCEALTIISVQSISLASFHIKTKCFCKHSNYQLCSQKLRLWASCQQRLIDLSCTVLCLQAPPTQRQAPPTQRQAPPTQRQAPPTQEVSSDSSSESEDEGVRNKKSSAASANKVCIVTHISACMNYVCLYVNNLYCPLCRL